MPTTILTGLPRSGTTLLCLLLNAAPDTVAMVEPMGNEGERSADALFARMAPFIGEARRTVLEQHVFLSQTVDGHLADNFLASPTAGDADRRQSRATKTLVPVTRPLSPDFHLFIKHPDRFSAILPQLAAAYPVFALVRHPLATLAAWQTAEMPVYYGRMPWCELAYPMLAARLDAVPDRIARQVEVLRFLFDLYVRHLGRDRIIRYEDLVADPAHELRRLGVEAAIPSDRIHRTPLYERYAGVDLSTLADAVGPSASAFASLYPDIGEAAVSPNAPCDYNPQDNRT